MSSKLKSLVGGKSKKNDGDLNAITEKLDSLNINVDNITLDNLDKIKTLGTGTFGRVYLVHHKASQQYFAMKVLKKTDIIRMKQIEHVNNERAILADLKHPFIVRLHKSFQDDVNLYMLLDYIPGGEIFSHLRRAGRFSADVSRYYATQIITAFEYMHSKDMIYRDLKPENLLLDPKGNIKVTDFGFAKCVKDRTWTLCGTPEYLAPEIIQSSGHGKAADWWALGILIYEMLAGYPPYYDDHPFGIYEKIIEGNLTFPSHFDPIARDLIKRLLNPDRSRRLGSLKNGAGDIKNHKWFKGVDWTKVVKGKYPAPIVPKVLHAGDTHNFDDYPEIEDEPQEKVTDTFRQLFKDF